MRHLPFIYHRVILHRVLLLCSLVLFFSWADAPRKRICMYCVSEQDCRSLWYFPCLLVDISLTGGIVSHSAKGGDPTKTQDVLHTICCTSNLLGVEARPLLFFYSSTITRMDSGAPHMPHEGWFLGKRSMTLLSLHVFVFRPCHNYSSRVKWSRKTEREKK